MADRTDYFFRQKVTDAELEDLTRYTLELTARDFFVLATDPRPDERLRAGEPIRVIFSLPIFADPANLARVTLLDDADQPVQATVAGEGRYVTLTPAAPLTPGATYTVAVDAAFESLSERTLYAAERHRVHAGAAADLRLEGDYTWTIDLPAPDFPNDRFNPDITVPVSAGLIFGEDGALTVDYGDDLAYPTRAYVEGSTLHVPSLLVAVTTSFSDTRGLVAQLTDADGDGVADRGEGTLTMTGPGFEVHGVTFVLTKDGQGPAECPEGPQGDVAVTVERADGAPPPSPGKATPTSWASTSPTPAPASPWAPARPSATAPPTGPSAPSSSPPASRAPSPTASSPRAPWTSAKTTAPLWSPAAATSSASSPTSSRSRASRSPGSPGGRAAPPAASARCAVALHAALAQHQPAQARPQILADHLDHTVAAHAQAPVGCDAHDPLPPLTQRRDGRAQRLLPRTKPIALTRRRPDWIKVARRRLHRLPRHHRRPDGQPPERPQDLARHRREGEALGLERPDERARVDPALARPPRTRQRRGHRCVHRQACDIPGSPFRLNRQPVAPLHRKPAWISDTNRAISGSSANATSANSNRTNTRVALLPRTRRSVRDPVATVQRPNQNPK